MSEIAQTPMEKMTYQRWLIGQAIKGFCASIDGYGPGRMINEDEIADDAVAIANAVCANLAGVTK